MRQYGEVPALLSTASPPAVSSATGLGTGGGVGLDARLSPNGGQSFGQFLVYAGQDAAVGGSLVITYAQTPPTMFYAPSEAFTGFAVAGQGTTTHTLTWSNKLSPNKPHQIGYEWSVSK